MAKPKSDILLYGTPSTTFLHIKKVVESVIRKANLPVILKEVTNIQEILDAEIETVPSLKVEDRVFNFSQTTESNLLLKNAIIHLLQSYNYGDWPCITLPFDDAESIINPFLYAHQLADRMQACLELQYVSLQLPEQKKALKSLIKKVKTTNEEPMGQILSRPIIGHRVIQGRICDHIVDYVKKNNHRPLLVPNTIWENCQREISRIQPHLSAPLLSIGENEIYHSKMKAEWWIDPERLSRKTFRSIERIFEWYDLDITVIASRNQKAAVLNALKVFESEYPMKIHWIEKSGPKTASHTNGRKMILLNSSQIHPILKRSYGDLQQLIANTPFVALLPEAKAPTGGRGRRFRSRTQPKTKEYVPS